MRHYRGAVAYRPASFSLEGCRAHPDRIAGVGTSWMRVAARDDLSGKRVHGHLRFKDLKSAGFAVAAREGSRCRSHLSSLSQCAAEFAASAGGGRWSKRNARIGNAYRLTVLCDIDCPDAFPRPVVRRIQT